MNKTVINGEYLNELLNKLNKKETDINELKNEILLPTLKECGNYLTTVGQIDKINNIKNKIIEIEKDIKSLANKLEKSIIPGYENTNNMIKKNFNIDLYDEINEYIKIINENEK